MLNRIRRSLGSGSSGSGDPFAPRMPVVDEPGNLDDVFAMARTAAAAGGTGAAGGRARNVVVVTPGRMLMLSPCPAPGSMSDAQTEPVRRLMPPDRPRNVAVVAYTQLEALQKNITKAIPFFGMLAGLAYIGHSVWVFEGHESALAYGCRDADVLLVDGGMAPFLREGWAKQAAAVMRGPNIFLHDRATFSLRPVDPTA